MIEKIVQSIVSPMMVPITGGDGTGFSVANQPFSRGEDTLTDAAAHTFSATTGTIDSIGTPTGANVADWTISEAAGVVTIKPSGDGLANGPYSLTIPCFDGPGQTGNQDDVIAVITTPADEYTVDGATEYSAAITDFGTGAGGSKAIALIGGDYAWANGNLNNKTFNNILTVQSHNNADRARFVGSDSSRNEIRNADNLTFFRLDFYAPFTDGVSSVNDGMFAFVNGITDVVIEECDFSSNYRTKIEADGYTDGLTGYAGVIGGDGTSITVGDFVIRNNDLHANTILLNLFETTVAGSLTIEQNNLFDVGTDAMKINGEQHNVNIQWNDLYSPLTGAPIFDVASIDTGLDQITFTENHGWVGSFVVNVISTTVTPPDGLIINEPYSATVIDLDTIEITDADITSAGVDVEMWKKDLTHGDWIQFIPSTGTAVPVNNVNIIGNRMLSARNDAIPTGQAFQGIFMEDINPQGNDAEHYTYVTIGGNMLYGRVNHGISLYNPYNCFAVGNTLVAPSDASFNRRPFALIGFQEANATTGNNFFTEDIAQSVTVSNLFSPADQANQTIENNSEIQPVSYTTYFDGPVTEPGTVAEFTTNFSIKSGSPADLADPKIGAEGTGYVNYTTRTFSHPSLVPTVPFAFTVGQWSLADPETDGDLTVTIIELPFNGRSDITDLEYSVDDAAWVSFGSTALGDHTISGLTNDVSVDIEVRAVNAIGDGPDSDVKAATPTAPTTAFEDDFTRGSQPADVDNSALSGGTGTWDSVGAAARTISPGLLETTNQFNENSELRMSDTVADDVSFTVVVDDLADRRNFVSMVCRSATQLDDTYYEFRFGYIPTGDLNGLRLFKVVAGVFTELTSTALAGGDFPIGSPFTVFGSITGTTISMTWSGASDSINTTDSAIASGEFVGLKIHTDQAVRIQIDNFLVQ